MKLVLAVAATLLAAPALAEPLKITAVNNVLATFAERIGGEAVTVTMPAPEGSDPALWKPAIADISAIQQSDLILLNGAGYAAWTTKTSLPRSRTVTALAGLEREIIETEGAITHSHGPEGEHAHTGQDPHTWLDFALAARQARAIGDALARKLPEADLGTDALVAELEALDARAASIAPRLPQPIVASHPRYAYFARAYGLEIISLEWGAGQEPGPEDIAELEQILSETSASIFLWEKSPSEAAAAAVSALGLENVTFETGAQAGENMLSAATTALDSLEKLAE
ncbi:metal ABC transporter substrate-binding protein [Algicella marina]|uniref:High-affinity zinc uptake system protein ZnuA n=1 Tax=Algicella marina TaxID=2683284 RepID=A0A6P1T317_9RHOB|nr:metal ABC transporter substrate-binding protein [Algicella marina]QHQ36407.1 zinc ABC transporter substrate-binding protein [Algicella marina]